MGHFKVTLCLYLKTSPRAKSFLSENEFDLSEGEQV